MYSCTRKDWNFHISLQAKPASAITSGFVNGSPCTQAGWCHNPFNLILTTTTYIIFISSNCKLSNFLWHFLGCYLAIGSAFPAGYKDLLCQRFSTSGPPTGPRNSFRTGRESFQIVTIFQFFSKMILENYRIFYWLDREILWYLMSKLKFSMTIFALLKNHAS